MWLKCQRPSGQVLRINAKKKKTKQNIGWVFSHRLISSIPGQFVHSTVLGSFLQ